MSRRPAGVLWDMDGTIVDTEPYFIDALAQMVEDAGGTLSDADRYELVGASMQTMAAVAVRAAGLRNSGEVIDGILAEVLRRLGDGIPWRPGALELLRAVRAAGVPTALVTMSFRSVADAVVRGIPFSAFDVVVTGEEVARGKPDPEAYLRAAELLGVPVRDCVVVEDSPPGVAAAVAAGATVVAVPCYVDLPVSDAYTTWSTLVGRDLASLQQVVGSRKVPAAPGS